MDNLEYLFYLSSLNKIKNNLESLSLNSILNSSNIEITTNDDSTTLSVNAKEDEYFFNDLKENQDYFFKLLLTSDFEDGISNNAINYIENKLQEKPFVTVTWLSELFNNFITKKEEDVNSISILTRLLKIIAYVHNENYLDYIKGPLLLILRACLSTDDIYLQEAALMVIETWKTKECSELLESINFTNNYIIKYADTLKSYIN